MHIAIIGNGISGVTAARYLRKLSNHQITLISSESKHFFSRTALMYVYMGHMRAKDIKPYEDHFWAKNRIDLVQAKVKEVMPTKNALVLSDGGEIKYDQLILATGSKTNKFGWPGQDLKGVGGLYHWQDLEQMEAYSPNLKRAVIVGGGLIGIEMAEMYRSRNIDVTLVVREDSYWNNVLPKEESEMISRHIRDHHIDLRLGKNLGEILDDGTGTAKGIVIKESGETIDCGYVGLTAGVSPNVDFLKDSGIALGRGILVNQHLKTNFDNIYAIGDCVQLQEPREGRRAIEAVWYTGRMMGETVAYNICDTPISYDPGIWFNSAKFLDIEYQVYGAIPNKTPEGITSFYWEHPTENKAIRINYDTQDQTIKGFNLMGIRFRHEVCEKWIKSREKIDQVMEDLSLANFDPEFYTKNEQSIVSAFNKQTGKQINLSKSKGGFNAVFKFLKSK